VKLAGGGGRSGTTALSQAMRSRFADRAPKSYDLDAPCLFVDDVDDPPGGSPRVEQFGAIGFAGLAEPSECFRPGGDDGLNVMFQSGEVSSGDRNASGALQISNEVADVSRGEGATANFTPRVAGQRDFGRMIPSNASSSSSPGSPSRIASNSCLSIPGFST
jgi:hypothetical protein